MAILGAEKLKMYLGNEEIVGACDWGLQSGSGDGYSLQASFSGTFTPDECNMSEFFEQYGQPERELHFHTYRDTIERLWTNILFRMFDKGGYRIADVFKLNGMITGIDMANDLSMDLTVTSWVKRSKLG